MILSILLIWKQTKWDLIIDSQDMVWESMIASSRISKILIRCYSYNKTYLKHVTDRGNGTCNILLNCNMCNATKSKKETCAVMWWFRKMLVQQLQCYTANREILYATHSHCRKFQFVLTVQWQLVPKTSTSGWDAIYWQTSFADEYSQCLISCFKWYAIFKTQLPTITERNLQRNPRIIKS